MNRIPVVQFMQQGFTLYSGVMSVRQLMDHAAMTEWDPEKGWDLQQQGYQRAPILEHYRRIAMFLQREGDPLLPTNALLASRNAVYGELHFTRVDGDLGYLDIPDSRTLFVIDYQHRWRGFKHAIEELGQMALHNVMIPVTILSNTPLSEEMKQFYLINNKQKRIDTDLALTLMQAMASESTEEELANLVGPRKRYQIRATRLVIRIAQLGSGPWASKIQEPNIPPDSSQIASIKSFVDSLKPIVSTRSPVYHDSDDDLVLVILAIWMGVLDLWPEWKTDFAQYAIQKTTGLFVIHRVASELLIPKMLSSGDRSSGLVTATLSNVGGLLSRDFWRTGGGIGTYSSAAGQRELAEKIVNAALLSAGP